MTKQWWIGYWVGFVVAVFVTVATCIAVEPSDVAALLIGLTSGFVFTNLGATYAEGLSRR